MPICKTYMSYFCYYKRIILIFSLTNLLINHKFFFSKVIINFGILLSFSCHMSKKLVEKNLDTYKLRIKKILLVQHSKVYAIKKAKLLAI